MAMRHREYNVRGVQFHPEMSIATEFGRKMLENFLSIACPEPALAAQGSMAEGSPIILKP